MYYFGVWEPLGFEYYKSAIPSHGLWLGNVLVGESAASKIPYLFRRYMDGGLVQETPGENKNIHGPQIEGKCFLHHSDGWTALAFWDRSKDPAFYSNSAFVAKGNYSFQQMLTIMKREYPFQTIDLPFQLVLVNGDKQD